jgi:hypothetical protein
MRRIIILLSAVALLGAIIAGSASTQQFPPHGHILLLGMEFDDTGEPVGFRKCVDLAGARHVPLHSHHDHLHFGKTGVKLATKANHWVVPTADLTPWANCEEFIEFIFGE